MSLRENDGAISIAAQLSEYGGPEKISLVSVPRPSMGAEQVLVRVEAVGLNPIDWKIRSGHLKDFFPMQLPVILGLEFAGVVVGLGSEVETLQVGNRVMGCLGGEAGFGAYSQYVAVGEDRVCLTPDHLTSLQGASIPAAALTAWSASHAAGQLKRGQIILIHGAAGGVGGYAVQFAVDAGIEVYATASATSAKHVLALGATRVFDRNNERPEDMVDSLDLVLDLVGDASVDRLWRKLTSNGSIVSIAAPDISRRAPSGLRGIWHTMVMDNSRLREFAEKVAAGQLTSTIAEIVPFDSLPRAIESVGTGHPPGKIVCVLP